MKANELRLGNWIHAEVNGEWQDVQVTEINDHELNGFKSILRSAEGIPLTREWMDKLGFVESGPRSYRNGLLHILMADSLDQFDPEGRTYWNSWTIMKSQPKYVHELQNLFFALNKTELTVSE